MAVAPPAFPSPDTPSSIFASIDMGTNSFKLLIVRTDPSGRFFAIDQEKEPVVLGRDIAPTPYSISSQSTIHAVETLDKFKKLLDAHNVNQIRTRCVATAAVREARNRKEFVDCVMDNTGFEVEVLSGEEEARLAYLGVLQFSPIHDKLALTVDIGGGSTEFVIGEGGRTVFVTSLKLGHVTLTQKFPALNAIPLMRGYIRSVIDESGLVPNIKEHGFDIAVGSSGTICAIEKAVVRNYAHDIVDKAVLVGYGKRDWYFTRGELSSVVKRLCAGGKEEKVLRDKFFKRRSEFIVAGSILLEEIFDMLGVEEMQVSGYTLGQGVIAETLAKVCPFHDFYANARWQSVIRLAMRLNGKKQMRFAANCAGTAKEIFYGLRRCKELDGNENLTALLNEKDLEYLEAASLLHNIGLVTGKKGYHKQSYLIIMEGGYLHGYNAEEVKIIALLAKHHRKKFPKSDIFKEKSEEEKQRFRYLCAIIRMSVALQQHKSLKSKEGSDVKDQPLSTIIHLVAENRIPELRQETENFKEVFEL